MKDYFLGLWVSGRRKGEAVKSFNLITELAKEGKLSEHYNSIIEILEHFKYPDLFLKATKKYFSVVPRNLISKTEMSSKVSYSAIRKRLTKNNQHLRFKELRSHFATYLRDNGVLAEYVDLLQGRISKSVFDRHYPKVEDTKGLVQKVNTSLPQWRVACSFNSIIFDFESNPRSSKNKAE